MKKNLCKLVILLTITLVCFSGCSKIVDNKLSSNKDMKVVEDCAGRQVEVPKEPKRIAVLYAYAGHLTTLLGEQDKIVGLVEGLKRDVLMNYKLDNINQLSVPYNSGVINIEELIKIKPDIAFVRLSTANNEAEVEKLEKANIPFVVVDYNNMKEQIKSIEVLGQVLNKEEKAKKYIDFYNETIDYVKNQTKDIKKEDKIKVYHSVNEAVRTDSKGSIGDEISKAANIINVSTNEELNISEEKAYSTLEQIYKWNPEAIIVNDAAVNEYMKSDNKWEGLNAVKNNKIYNLPAGLTRWGHPGSLETPMAVLFISNLFYTECFEDMDIKKATKDYYKNFFDLDLKEDEIESILSGVGMRLQKEN